ncbi:hypothetical protein [Streptomyces sp. CBMA156]|uniref:hypothetical protein n=1 Tax=Streptomyces sp. CBMA156 TaxID=1930280 RepID=UPI001661AE1B|nr:hypothetical protein [Streptomyces sp. CBMA156]MBD0670768.1 hypothetical protein [Streptomyces sp. CBMA156]
MSRLTWLSQAAATVLLTLETVAVVLFFCIAVPLFYNGVGFEDELAPRPKAVPYVFASAGLVMAGLNGWAIRAVWRLPADRGRRVLVLAAGAQAALLGHAALSGEHLFTVFALSVLLTLGTAAWSSCQGEAR